MPYVMSSPWVDAAEYGRGLGDQLAEAMIRLPAIRAKMAETLALHRQALNQQLWERQEREKELGLRAEQVKATQAYRAETQQATQAYRERGLADREKTEANTNKRDEALQAYRAETQQALQAYRDRKLGDDEDKRKTAFATQNREAVLRGQVQRARTREQQIRAAARRQHARDTDIWGEDTTANNNVTAQITAQIIANAQQGFKKNKNLDLAKKYIMQQAQENGVTINPDTVVFK